MTDKKFDELMRDALEDYREPAPDVWEGVSADLASRRRWRVARRISYFAVAAAACLLFGLVLFDGPQQVPTQDIREVPTPVAEVAAPDSQSSDIPSSSVPVTGGAVTSRVGKASSSGVSGSSYIAMAEGLVGETATDGMSAIKSPEESVSEPSAEPSEEFVDAGPSQVPGDLGILPASALPEEVWEDDSYKNEHTSQISILSDLSTFNRSGNGSSGGPMYAGGIPFKGEGTTAPVRMIEMGENVRFHMPLNLGVQFKTRVAGGFYVGAGISYSMLSSRFDALIDKVYYSDVHNQQHYIGIPVSFYYNFVNSEKWGVYASAGGSIEKGLRQKYLFGNEVISDKIGGVQFSANVGLGAEYWFVPHLGIYVDPSLVYYFKCDQPVSIRTQQPLQAKFELGLRFRF